MISHNQDQYGLDTRWVKDKEVKVGRAKKFWENQTRETNQTETCFFDLVQSDPVKGVLLLPVLLGVVSNGNGKEVLWDYCVCMCVHVALIWSPSVISLTSSHPLSGQLSGNASVTKYSSLFHWFLVGGPVWRKREVGYMRALNRQDMRGLCRLPMPEMWRDEQQCYNVIYWEKTFLGALSFDKKWQVIKQGDIFLFILLIVQKNGTLHPLS